VSARARHSIVDPLRWVKGCLIEADRSDVFDPRGQLEVRVATGGDHRLTPCQQASTEAPALVVWLDEHVNEVVAHDREVADRNTIDNGHPRVEH
jgi:hypothetical protein